MNSTSRTEKKESQQEIQQDTQAIINTLIESLERLSTSLMHLGVVSPKSISYHHDQLEEINLAVNIFNTRIQLIEPDLRQRFRELSAKVESKIPTMMALMLACALDKE